MDLRPADKSWVNWYRVSPSLLHTRRTSHTDGDGLDGPHRSERDKVRQRTLGTRRYESTDSEELNSCCRLQLAVN